MRETEEAEEIGDAGFSGLYSFPDFLLFIIHCSLIVKNTPHIQMAALS